MLATQTVSNFSPSRVFQGINIDLSNSYSSSGITCFTCTNSSSNRECDRLAVDRACREDSQACLTLHVMAVHGMRTDLKRKTTQMITHSVRKKCSPLSECVLTAGCQWVGHRKICQ